MVQLFICLIIFTIAFNCMPYFSRYGPAVALFLIGIGTGGIKPCVSAFGGDQFKAGQVKIILLMVKINTESVVEQTRLHICIKQSHFISILLNQINIIFY